MAKIGVLMEGKRTRQGMAIGLPLEQYWWVVNEAKRRGWSMSQVMQLVVAKAMVEVEKATAVDSEEEE